MDKMCISLRLELKSAAQCSKSGRNSAIKNAFTTSYRMITPAKAEINVFLKKISSPALQNKSKT